MLVRVVVLASLVLAAGCEREKDRVRFDGMTFRAKTTVDKDDRRNFTATIFEVSKGPEAAVEAGRYEGTKHCIRNYGSSRIVWTVSPDTPLEELSVVDNSITFQGACVG